MSNMKDNLMKTLLFSILSIVATSVTAQDGIDLFDDGYLHEIRLYNVDTTYYIDTKDYQEVNMLIDGAAVDAVGMKRKGNISGYTETNKYGMQIKTNKYVDDLEYDGIREWTLHMNYQDPTMLREKLTYDLCADMGLYSLRSAFAKVYLNDVYWGLFTILEGKDEMYKQVFDNRDMDAVESEDFGTLCYIDDNVDSYFGGAFEQYVVENGDEETAKARFVEMLAVANNSTDQDFLAAMATQLHVRDFMRYQAVNVALLNMDSYIAFRGNQIYVYDEEEGLWQVTPWDFNASFGLWNTNNAEPETYPFIPDVIRTGCLAGRINTVPEMRQYYLEAMCELQQILGDTDSYYAEIDRLADQVRAAVYADTRKVVTDEEFELGLAFGYQNLFSDRQPGLKELISVRQQVLSEGLVTEGYECSVSAEEVAASAVAIYPNPTTDFIHLTLDRATVGIQLLDALGRAINVDGATVFATDVDGRLSLDLSEVDAGWYYLSVLTVGTFPIVRR